MYSHRKTLSQGLGLHLTCTHQIKSPQSQISTSEYSSPTRKYLNSSRLSQNRLLKRKIKRVSVRWSVIPQTLWTMNHWFYRKHLVLHTVPNVKDPPPHPANVCLPQQDFNGYGMSKIDGISLYSCCNNSSTIETTPYFCLICQVSVQQFLLYSSTPRKKPKPFTLVPDILLPGQYLWISVWRRTIFSPSTGILSSKKLKTGVGLY